MLIVRRGHIPICMHQCAWHARRANIRVWLQRILTMFALIVLPVALHFLWVLGPVPSVLIVPGQQESTRVCFPPVRVQPALTVRQGHTQLRPVELLAQFAICVVQASILPF